MWAAATGKARLPTVASLTVSSGRTQSSSTRDINSRGERTQIPWCVAVEDCVCQHGDFELTVIRTVRYLGNALTDSLNASRVQCLALLVHTVRVKTVNTTASVKFRNKS